VWLEERRRKRVPGATEEEEAPGVLICLCVKGNSFSHVKTNEERTLLVLLHV